MKTNILEAICGGGVGLLAYLTGLNWILILCWAIIIALDILSGVVKGLLLGWSSRKLTTGLLFKLYQLILVFALIILNLVLLEMGYDFHLSAIIIGAFIVKDIVSIAENGKDMGYVSPDIVTTVLNKAKMIFNSKLEEGEKKDE